MLDIHGVNLKIESQAQEILRNQDRSIESQGHCERHQRSCSYDGSHSVYGKEKEKMISM